MTTVLSSADAFGGAGEVSPVDAISVVTRRGIEAEVAVAGPADGSPVVFLHGFVGPLGDEPLAAALAASGHRVYSPVWPGYGEASTAGGEDQLDDMLDFALHGLDIIDALRLGHANRHPAPHLIGHSMGGMIAAEMAALAPASCNRLVLIAPLGLWLDEHPIADIYALLPYEFPPLLFHDAAAGSVLMAGGGIDFTDRQAIQRFLISNSRRLGNAGKILFPIPNRRLSKRLYRISNDTMLIWGDDDRLLPAPYARAWADALPHAIEVMIERAGHMCPYEQPAETAAAVARFLAGPVVGDRVR